MGRLRSAVVVAAPLACNAPAIQGGQPIEPGREPEGTPVAVFQPAECRSASGGPLPALPGSVTLLRTARGEPLLIEHRPDRVPLLVHNTFSDGDGLVFQAVLKSPGGPPLLRDYRLPPPGARHGRLAVVERWASRPAGESAFRGEYSEALYSCLLVPQ